MNYWLNLFTTITWNEFRKYGAKVSGFRERHRRCLGQVQSGDIFLCYVAGIMRWTGALEVLGKSDDKTRIWKNDEFPIRFTVHPIIVLDAEHGVVMEKLEGRVDFYSCSQDAGKFKGFIRRSPTLFKRHEDSELILKFLREAHPNNQVNEETY